MSELRALESFVVTADGRPHLPSRSDVDSWLEYRFAWLAIKHLRPEIDLRPQVWVVTPQGRFRVDFLTEGFRVPLVFECDGSAYHQDPERDAHRDDALLESRAVWGIYHLPYRDLVEWPEWCLLRIAQRHFELFRDAALVNLRTLTQRGPEPRLGMTYQSLGTPR